MIYHKPIDNNADEAEDEEARRLATEHAAKSALLSAVPFGLAAITMVVSPWCDTLP